MRKKDHKNSGLSATCFPPYARLISGGQKKLGFHNNKNYDGKTSQSPFAKTIVNTSQRALRKLWNLQSRHCRPWDTGAGESNWGDAGGGGARKRNCEQCPAGFCLSLYLYLYFHIYAHPSFQPCSKKNPFLWVCVFLLWSAGKFVDRFAATHVKKKHQRKKDDMEGGGRRCTRPGWFITTECLNRFRALLAKSVDSFRFIHVWSATHQRLALTLNTHCPFPFHYFMDSKVEGAFMWLHIKEDTASHMAFVMC